jgi:putative membrane protein
VKPLLVLFALPFVVLTLGVGILFINALLYLLVGRVVGGFEVDGFGSAFLGALIVTLFEVMFRGWIEGTPGVRWKVRVSRGPAGAAGPVGPKPAPRQVKAKDDVIDI